MLHWTVIFIASGFFLGIVNWNKYKRWINYANCFIWLWYAACILASIGFFEFYVPNDIAFLSVLVMTICFEVGVHFGSRLVFKVKKRRSVLKKDVSEISISSSLFCFLNFACTTYMVPYVKTGLKYLAIGGFNTLRQESLRTALYPTIMKLIMADIIQPIILVTVLICVYELIWNKRFHLCFIAAIINAILYVLIFAGRWIIMEILMIILITVIDKYKLKIVSLIVDNKIVAFLGLVGVAGLIQITSQRSIQANGSILSNIYSYFIGSIHLFGVYTSSPKKYLLFDSRYYLYGAEFFSGFLDIIYLILNRFANTDLRSGINILNDVTQTFVDVSPTVKMNNNVTMLYGFLRDGGYMALVIESFLVGTIYAKVEKMKDTNFSKKIIWTFMRSLILFLLFEWMYARSSMIMVIVFVILLTKKPFIMGVK